MKIKQKELDAMKAIILKKMQQQKELADKSKQLISS